MQKSLIDKWFKDKDGKVAIIQLPNIPIIIWGLAKLLVLFHLSNHLETAITYTGTAFLIIWAYLELTSGVNYLRRVLGFIVLVGLLLPKFL